MYWQLCEVNAFQAAKKMTNVLKARPPGFHNCNVLITRFLGGQQKYNCRKEMVDIQDCVKGI